jgi:hypothetical protein
MRRVALALLGIFALAGTAGDAFGQATTEVELPGPGMVLQATDTWANWHTYWTSRMVVCAAPCTAVVPSDGTYRIVGEAMPPSAPFTLPLRDRVRLEVGRGSRALHDTGGVLLLVGGVTALVGAMILAGSGKTTDTDVGGLVTLGAGGVMMGVGLPMLLSSATTVHFD